MTLDLGLKDLDAKDQLHHFGARFKALHMGILMAASNFCIVTSGLEQCSVGSVLTPAAGTKMCSWRPGGGGLLH